MKYIYIKSKGVIESAVLIKGSEDSVAPINF